MNGFSEQGDHQDRDLTHDQIMKRLKLGGVSDTREPEPGSESPKPEPEKSGADSQDGEPTKKKKRQTQRKGARPEVLVPGEHKPLDVKIGHDKFVKAVVPHLPIGDTLFRHGSEVVSIIGDPGKRSMAKQKAENLQIEIDSSVALHQHRFVKDKKKDEFVAVVAFKACAKGEASVVLAHLQQHPDVAEIESLSNYPVWLRDGDKAWFMSPTGYHARARHYYDEPPELDGFQPAELDPNCARDQEWVHQLISPDNDGPFRHFPFRTRASAVGTLATMLTLAMRPGIKHKVPNVVVGAPLTRTGKTILAGAIVQIVSGIEEPSVRTLHEREEEIDKGIVAFLRRGCSYVIYDNIRNGRRIDSASLAALSTSRRYTSRILGVSAEVEFPNNALLFITGNNLSMSSELTKRTLPIELQPEDDHPELRPNLPNLVEQVTKMRPEMLATLHGMIAAWVRAGCPSGDTKKMPDYSAWLEIIGGVLALWGLDDDFLGNLGEWKEEVDAETDDNVRFALEWHTKAASLDRECWTATQLLDLAEDAKLFPEVFCRERTAQAGVFGKSVLAPLIKVPRTIDVDGTERLFKVDVRVQETARSTVSWLPDRSLRYFESRGGSEHHA